MKATLLEALKNALPYVGSPEAPQWVIDEANAAIANAGAESDLLQALKQIREIGGFSGLDHLKSVDDLIAKTEGRAE